MTPGERMVWAAVYAATWSRLHSQDCTAESRAAIAAYDAGHALDCLRWLSNQPTHSAAEYRDVLIGDKP